jgi:hypothetical protein
MNQIQTIAAYLPYMTCPGNHEWAYNFSNYVNRFSMPNYDDPTSIGGDNNHFFSLDIGPVHLVSFSTEFYFFFQYGFTQIKRQYEWLENDLKVRIPIFRFLYFYEDYKLVFSREPICLKTEPKDHVILIGNNTLIPRARD